MTRWRPFRNAARRQWTDAQRVSKVTTACRLPPPQIFITSFLSFLLLHVPFIILFIICYPPCSRPPQPLGLGGGWGGWYSTMGQSSRTRGGVTSRQSRDLDAPRRGGRFKSPVFPLRFSIVSPFHCIYSRHFFYSHHYLSIYSSSCMQCTLGLLFLLQSSKQCNNFIIAHAV